MRGWIKTFVTSFVVTFLAILFVLPTPVQAKHLRSHCRTHNGPDGAGGVYFYICLHLNRHDGSFALGTTKLQAKTTFSDYYADGPNDQWAVELHIRGMGLNRNGEKLRHLGPVQVNNWNVNHAETGWEVIPTGDGGRYTTGLNYHICFVGFPNEPCSIVYGLDTRAFTP